MKKNNSIIIIILIIILLLIMFYKNKDNYYYNNNCEVNKNKNYIASYLLSKQYFFIEAKNKKRKGKKTGRRYVTYYL